MVYLHIDNNSFHKFAQYITIHYLRTVKLMKTYKFKLKPTNSQRKKLEECIATTRFLYNLALSQKIMAYEMRKVNVSCYDQYNQLPPLKKEFPWIANVYSDVLQEVLDRLDKTYKNFFRGAGFPKFSKKGEYNSFTYKRSVKVEEDYIKFPKLGQIKYFNSRKIEGILKTSTIVKEGNNWFVCIVAEYETPFETIVIDNQNPIGCDMGVSKFLALSNNTFIESPSFLEPNLVKLRVLQRKMSRQVKGSTSRNKTKEKIRKLYKKISNTRLDFLHKTSTNLANEFSALYMEDLNLQKMQQSGFTNVNRGMSDNGFGTLKTLLSYKFKERGKHLGLVNPAYTSQTCNACGTVDKKSRLSQAEFVCTSCGNIDNADLNSSKNILSKGIRESTKRKTLV